MSCAIKGCRGRACRFWYRDEVAKRDHYLCDVHHGFWLDSRERVLEVLAKREFLERFASLVPRPLR